MFRSTLHIQRLVRTQSLRFSLAPRRHVLRTPFSTSAPSLNKPANSRKGPPPRCPQCDAPLPSPLPACPKCAFIAVPRTATYHSLFDLPYEPNPFVVDAARLKAQFHVAQRVCHPDVWAGKGKQDASSELSTYVNEAYQTLLDPFRRAEYLLRLHDIEVSETDQVEDMDLLMSIMEAREEIETAGPDDAALVQDVARKNQEQIDKLCATIERLVGEEDWVGVKDATVRLKYLQSIQTAARKWPTIENDEH
ncbi:hypothetical protein PLICRDRAFT_36637, partial [Plicaturopsis crispa FD-325 SS-3]